ncbi:hypothetical protein M758_UG023000 [Ceratodon purpureus]|nr:hypothetical protein M758_UG023000 [Ceratodon purpureus]
MLKGHTKSLSIAHHMMLSDHCQVFTRISPICILKMNLHLDLRDVEGSLTDLGEHDDIAEFEVVELTELGPPCSEIAERLLNSDFQDGGHGHCQMWSTELVRYSIKLLLAHATPEFDRYILEHNATSGQCSILKT